MKRTIFLWVFLLSVVVTLPACGQGEPDTVEPGLTAESPIEPVNPTPLIWDDDGSRDGVIALLYFLSNPAYEVKAITVSHGLAHPKRFVEKLSGMLASLDRTDIPIAAGRETPLSGNNTFPKPWRQDSDDFWGVDFPAGTGSITSKTAAQLIVDTVNQAKEPVIVFVSGSHTNLAEALCLDPSIVDGIQRVVIMGGAVEVPGNIASAWPALDNKVAEWNIWIDPVAVDEVLKSGIPLTITPLDATDQVLWTKSDVADWEKSGREEGTIAADLLERQLASWSASQVLVWDLVAAVTAGDSQLCETEEFHIEVITEGDDLLGQTVVNSGLAGNALVCMNPDSKAMKNHVAGMFENDN
jgi:purine nucleosidase/pyrimidine-specific ribonucleoside hydrolase